MSLKKRIIPITMNQMTIIWDFDGTLLPNDPLDSEQSLLMYKLYEAGEKLPLFLRALTRFLIYADYHEHLRKTFKKFFNWFMQGTSVTALDRVCQRLADKIPETDRQTILHLKDEGHNMMVLSCGTANLSEGTLKKAGLDHCFTAIAGNRFDIKDGLLADMSLRVPHPEDKVTFLTEKGISPDSTLAVGDGYTDIPLLDWARISVMLDRTGQKQKKYAHKKYHFVKSISEILEMV